MPDARPLQPSVTLIHTSIGDRVQVQHRDVPGGWGAAEPMELQPGEVVRCLRNDEDGVLIARDDGSRILVPVQSARKVGIRWFPDSSEPDESIDGLSPDIKSDPEQRAGSWRSRRERLQVGRPRAERDPRRAQRQDPARGRLP